ncbi:uncharacterized protein LOC134280363 [Saccostrea cucullata]|uniref:uncharacterized protein LOC134280363 n=1 Tax=Saccostrea cuccullata TaxID=36930 RepID=UPI002ED35069
METEEQKGVCGDNMKTEEQKGVGGDNMETEGQKDVGGDNMRTEGQKGVGGDNMRTEGQKGVGGDNMETEGQKGVGGDNMETEGQKGVGGDNMETEGQKGVGSDNMETEGQKVFDVKAIENLVFSGGGAKGVAYGGVIEVLKEKNILSYVKRFAGTSAGSIVAALLAMGCDVQKIQQLMKTNFDDLLKDCCCGLCTCTDACCCVFSCCCSCYRGCMGRIKSYFLTCCGITNLLCQSSSCRKSSFGMYTGKKFKTWIGNRFKELRFKETVTFKELYEHEKKYKELCIVVTNISTQIEEYCHVKTTPDMEIRQAIRMSMSIPVVFEEVRMINVCSGREAAYVDGGLLCNYPVFCFDGWWLSMKPEHSFFRKLTNIASKSDIYKERFKADKDGPLCKTLGFVLFLRQSVIKQNTTEIEERSNETEPLTDSEKSLDKEFANIDSKLKRKFVSLNKGSIETMEDNLTLFLEFVETKEKEGKLNKSAFIDGLQKVEFKKHNGNVFGALFGSKATPGDVWKDLTHNKSESENLEFTDISRFITKRTGYSIDQWYSGFSYTPSGTTKEFFSSLTSTMITNSSRINLKFTDVDRTVGINTKHITALDFNMEEADKDFLIKCGKQAMNDFLETYKKEHRTVENSLSCHCFPWHL